MNEAFEKWFKENENTLPTWYSNPYDEKALELAFNAGMLRAAEIVEEQSVSVSMYATSSEAMAVNEAIISLINMIRKEADSDGFN